MLDHTQAVEIINQCLTQGKGLKYMIERIRLETGTGLIEATDMVVLALRQSKHPKALTRLYNIRTRIERYKNIRLPPM